MMQSQGYFEALPVQPRARPPLLPPREPATVLHRTATRIPTRHGQFLLHYFDDEATGKSHVALVLGEVAGAGAVLTRIHSSCFTGDLFGSLRCDCGPQLEASLGLIAAEGCGVLVYLDQEGRGIGLVEKLKAYQLQDQGLDTLEANLALGHNPDGRDYGAAAAILQHLRPASVRLLTNNPAKVSGLERHGIAVRERLPLPPLLGPENAGYLFTKERRMNHLLSLLTTRPVARPRVTVSYAQSLDGSIALPGGRPAKISGQESLKLTHRLRSAHDAILVGIGTIVSDDPQLNVRLIEGPSPQPVVLDSRLRLPLEARVRTSGSRAPWVATTEAAETGRRADLRGSGTEVIDVPADECGLVHLPSLMTELAQRGIASVMVEGGARVLRSFMAARLVDQVVVTVAPILLGGVSALSGGLQLPNSIVRLADLQCQRLGEDLVLSGTPVWNEEPAA
jgi:3,4-dihydroxy 2-butanone 4-phosphate synthase/GTP cyclohydrolase II